MSPGVSQTAWAATRARPPEADRIEVLRRRRAVLARTEFFTSSAVSARWISTGACLRSASARTAFSVAVSSVYIACGATRRHDQVVARELAR